MTAGLFARLFRRAGAKRKTDTGERIAARFLEKRGYKILERNFRSRYGEIDLVCSDGGVVCFVEVKSRSTFDHGLPQEFVDARKIKKLSATASHYIKDKLPDAVPMRFDVVAVNLKDETATLLKNAFETDFTG